MARKNTPALPGLSRSATCSSKSCQRLAGHKGEHRGTLTAAPKVPSQKLDVQLAKQLVELGFSIEDAVQFVKAHPVTKSPAAKTAKPAADPEGVEVLSFDKYTVQPEPKARRTRRPAKQLRCRVVKAGKRCVRAYGHKQAGTRHSFAVVTQLPEAGPKGRDVQLVKGRVSRRSRYTTSNRPSARLA